MHLHILGIGGTFMSALALIAREAGYKVTGCDANCYPPVSDLLQAKQIEWFEGYNHIEEALAADCVIVGNAIKRGMPVLEAVLNAGKPYTSGPQWLAENILSRYQVLAVSGTHGKTTTTSMLAFILDYAGLNPGFLIGGVAPNFNTSATLGKGKWFVIEADEYDSAYFDKRPKLMHYRPTIAILNNLEFDHADIYENLEAIQKQFHYYLKTIPSKGIVLKPRDDAALNEVLNQGVFCPVEELALDGTVTWQAELLDDSANSFNVWYKGEKIATVNWPLIGKFNVENGLAAIAASVHAGVDPKIAAEALGQFQSVKRRLEVKFNQHGITIYDDFAHHPTAITKTLQALKNSQRHKRVLVGLEFASYTMKTGKHGDAIKQALASADHIFLLNAPEFNLSDLTKDWESSYQIMPSTSMMTDAIVNEVRPGDAVLLMSNRGFDNIYQQLSERLTQQVEPTSSCRA